MAAVVLSATTLLPAPGPVEEGEEVESEEDEEEEDYDAAAQRRKVESSESEDSETSDTECSDSDLYVICVCTNYNPQINYFPFLKLSFHSTGWRPS